MTKRRLRFALALFCSTLSVAPGLLRADDAEASKLYSEGRKLYLDGAYYKAGGIFAEAEEKADSNAIKANSLLAQVGAWRMCELYYREYQAIEKLLTLYPEYADFGPMVEREYEIGDEFARGRREPAFWAQTCNKICTHAVCRSCFFYLILQRKLIRVFCTERV